MNNGFPQGMKHPSNRIAAPAQATRGVEGSYTLIVGGERTVVKAGEEYVIPRGVPHSGEVAAGTRTIHHFGGHRADRALA